MINRIFATINNITPVCVSNYIVPLVYYDPNDGDADEVIVFINDSIGQGSKVRGGRNISNLRELSNHKLAENQSWAFVYPNETNIKTGKSPSPQISEIVEIITGVRKSEKTLIGENHPSDNANDIKIYVLNSLGNKNTF